MGRRKKGKRNIYNIYNIYMIRPYRASDSSVPELSPLWNVDCFSLSARPQVRWRERRRCDYQPAAAVPRDDDCNKRLASEDQQLQQTVQVITAGRPGNHGNNNHTRVLIKRGGDGDDFSHDECDQTQC